jgi:hypothetical protein
MDEAVRARIKEYSLAVAFAQAFADEVGQERMLAVVAQAFEAVQRRAGRDLAEELGSNTLKALAQHLYKQAAENEHMDVLEVTERHIALKFSRCVAWQAFQHLGAPELCPPYCESDHAYIRAFNPQMRLVRTQTIAGGDDCCDHAWEIVA